MARFSNGGVLAMAGLVLMSNAGPLAAQATKKAKSIAEANYVMCPASGTMTPAEDCPVISKVCPNGQIVPGSMPCPSPLPKDEKLCPGGKSVAVEQACPEVRAVRKECPNGVNVPVGFDCAKVENKCEPRYVAILSSNETEVECVLLYQMPCIDGQRRDAQGQCPPPRKVETPKKVVPLRAKHPNEWIPFSAISDIELARGQKYRVGFRLSVNEKGKPTACVIEKTSGSNLLDARVCERLMKKAKFHPRTENGAAVPSTYSSSFNVETF